MTQRTSKLRWIGLAVLCVLAMRGAFALLRDFPGWARTEVFRYVAPGERWTAFERCVDYTFIADRDTYLYLARSMDDSSTWVSIAPPDTHLMGPMVWMSPTRLRVPATFGEGCFRSLDGIAIEWLER